MCCTYDGMFVHVVVCVYQEMSKFRSQFCDCCFEERWVTKEYVENERGERFCQRCMTSINSIETTLFSATNNMVGSTLLSNFINTHVHTLNLTCCMSHSRRFPECYLPNFAM